MRLLFFLPLLIAAGSCSQPPAADLAIVHVTVIDMTGSPPLADQTVIIDKQRISAIGPSSSAVLPRTAQVIDATGKFLIPGLTDMHVHLTAAGEPNGSREFMLPLLLANGITTIRDMGSYLESIFPLRKEIADRKRLGPQIFTPGPFLDGTPPSFQPSIEINDRKQADQAVDQLVMRDVDFVKVQSMLNREAYFAIAAAAKREHIMFVGHVPDRVTAAEAADAGQHSIEHLTNVLRGCSSKETELVQEQLYVPPRKETPAQTHARIVRWQAKLLDSYSEQTSNVLIQKFKEKDVWQTPTLVLLENDAFPTQALASENNPHDKYIPQGTLEIWKKSRAQQMKFVGSEESNLRARLMKKSEAVVSQMERAGVHILAGTDSPAPYVYPGFGLHDELALLVEAGLSPLQALQAATSNPAEFLGTSKESGTIAKGKFADLLLLDASPLEDIRNTQNIRAVFVRGKLLDRVVLDKMLAGERAFVSVH